MAIRFERKVGQKSGFLTMLREVEPYSYGQRRFEFRCRCGKVIISTWGVKSCGCAKRQRAPGASVGDRYGRLVVREMLPIEKPGSPRKYLCDCDCGSSRIVSWKSARSCGCLLLEVMKSIPRYNALPEGEAVLRRLFRSYKRNAQVRQIEFKLTMEDFKRLVSQPCTYCGEQPLEISTHGKRCNGVAKAGGIDRQLSQLGYLADNCVPCCSQCNYAKRELTKEQFMTWARKLVAFNEVTDDRTEERKNGASDVPGS